MSKRPHHHPSVGPCGWVPLSYCHRVSHQDILSTCLCGSHCSQCVLRGSHRPSVCVGPTAANVSCGDPTVQVTSRVSVWVGPTVTACPTRTSYPRVCVGPTAANVSCRPRTGGSHRPSVVSCLSTIAQAQEPNQPAAHEDGPKLNQTRQTSSPRSKPKNKVQIIIWQK